MIISDDEDMFHNVQNDNDDIYNYQEQVQNKNKNKCLKFRPQCILMKKISLQAKQNPVSYLIKWKEDSDQPRRYLGEEWISLKQMKYQLDMIENYEIANYDGPNEENIPYNQKPVDTCMLSTQITCDPRDLQAILEVQRQKSLNTEIVDLTGNEIRSVRVKPKEEENKFTEELDNFVNVHLDNTNNKIYRRRISQQITQGSFLEKDRVQALLNCYKNTVTNKYQFLVTWEKRITGLIPRPSWISQDELKQHQFAFLRKIINERNLDITFA